MRKRMRVRRARDDIPLAFCLSSRRVASLGRKPITRHLSQNLPGRPSDPMTARGLTFRDIVNGGFRGHACVTCRICSPFIFILRKISGVITGGCAITRRRYRRISCRVMAWRGVAWRWRGAANSRASSRNDS